MPANMYVKQGAPTGDGWDNSRDFRRTANPFLSDWVPTVVNPYKVTDGGTVPTTQKALWWLHLMSWVCSLAFGGAVNFGIMHFQKKTVMAAGTTCSGGIAVTRTCFATDPSGTQVTIGILGGVATIVGIVALLLGAACLDAEKYRKQVWLNTMIQFFTIYGSCTVFYTFSMVADKDATTAFWMSLFACIFQLYAQVLLYCTSATLDVTALPRAFLPCFALSVQFISAMLISGGDFHMNVDADADSKMDHFTDSQKLCAWLTPIFLATSVLLMVGLRRFTRNTVTEISELGEYPFLRSLVLTPFLLSALLSVYKLSFIKADPSPTSFMFAMIGMLTTFSIVSVVFVPSGVSSNAGNADSLLANEK